MGLFWSQVLGNRSICTAWYEVAVFSQGAVYNWNAELYLLTGNGEDGISMFASANA